MGRTQTQADRELAWIKGSAFAAAPANLYLAAMLTVGTLASAGTEASGGGYARIAIASGGWAAIATGPDGTDRYITNSADVTFATPSADWGYVMGWELYDSLTVGNRLFYGSLDPAQFVPNGVPLKILAGTLRIGAS